MGRIAVLVVAALVVGGLPGCNQQSAGAHRNGAAEIVATEMRFNPNRIDARVGQPLTMTIVNHGAQRHDLAFPSIEMPGLRGVETLTMPGQSVTLTLTFDHTGSYVFICTIPGHAASGMTGAVFVSP